MRGNSKTVAVIGAGIVGVVSARFLQREGHAVVIVEAGNPGEGASFGNAGCLNGSSIVPMSMPGMIRQVPRWLMDPLGPLAIRWSYLPALAPWLVRFWRAGQPEKVKAQARALRALLAPCLDVLRPLAKEAGAEDLVHRRGHLWVYRSEESWRSERAAWALRRENGLCWEEFHRDALRELEPSLSRDIVKGVLVRENGHTTNPQRLVSCLLEAVLREGGRLERARALGFELDGARLRGVRTEAGLLAAQAAVLCAGAWSKPLAEQLGDAVPLETERGYHLMVREPEARPRIPIMDAERKFAATLMEDGLRLAGTVELAGLKAPPNWERARILLQQAHRLFPALRENYPKERFSVWMGHRPSLPDSLPAIGPSRRSPDVIYAFGHGHVGMAAAPMTGKLVAELISGKPPSIDVKPFSPQRF